MKKYILSLLLGLALVGCYCQGHATVTNGTNQVIYNGDGVTSIFPFSFNVYNSGLENDLVVQEETTSSGAITSLVLNTDYTVSLNGSIPSAGSITLTAGALAVGKSLSILRQLPLTQGVKEADNSPTPAAVRNNVYDRGIMISQQLQSQITRSILQSVFSSTSITLPAGVANYGLCWDATGLTITNCAQLAGTISVPIANSNLQTLTASSLVNGSSLFGTATLTSLSATNLFTTGNVGVGSSSPGARLDVQGSVRIFSGNVGIGSVSPGQLLDVQGTIRAVGIIAALPYIKLSNTQNSGTGGGTATSGSWGTIPINTTDMDTGSNVVSNSGGNFVLKAGTYDIIASNPFAITDDCQTRLFNTTGSSLVLTGTSEYSGSAASSNGAGTRSFIVGRFTVAAGQTLQFQYQVQSTRNTTGLGLAGSFGTEVYAVIQLWRVN